MKKPVKQKNTLRVCFDIETELFSDQFRNTRDLETRLRHAPRMRVACAFDETTWHFFLPSEFSELVKLLLTADEVLSFNGLQFDELVLRKHCKLKGKLPSKGKHIDLCHEISLTHHSVSLHRLSLLNLNEGKLTAGRSMATLDIEALKLACKSDVWQTYRLWDLWRKGTIKVPPPRAIKDDEDFVGPGHHMPALCPSCHSANSLELIDEDPEEMSEAQASDYLAGMFGCAVCCACGTEIDWEV
jgi:hypothetical protein